MPDFIKVAELNDVTEGALVPINLDDELICLTRVADQVYAFTDNCTHISGPLSTGFLQDCTITCPWHAAQFDVRTGKVTRGPARQDLTTYPVKIEGQSILISLPPEE